MDALNERLRVVRVKRVPAGVRAKRRRQQRKRRSKRKRWVRRYKRTRRFKRLKMMRKRLKKRIAGLKKPRRRVFVTSADPEGTTNFLQEANERLFFLREQVAGMEDDDTSSIEAPSADDVEEIVADPELAAVAVADAYATIGHLADLLTLLLQDEAERNPDAEAEVQKTLDVLADLKDDADMVQSVIGYPDEDAEEGDGESDADDDDADEPESNGTEDDSEPPESQEVGEVARMRPNR
jgi:hypothetical protein